MHDLAARHHLGDPAALAAELRALGDDLTGLLVGVLSDDGATPATARRDAPRG